MDTDKAAAELYLANFQTIAVEQLRIKLLTLDNVVVHLKKFSAIYEVLFQV